MVMTNLFNLPGPMFLILYIVLGIGVNLLLKYLFRKVESCFPAASRDCTDPYELAALRGGAKETMRIVLFSLIDRGLLKASDSAVVAKPAAHEMVMQPIEQTVVSYFQESRTVQELFSDSNIMKEGNKYSQKLADEGLRSDFSIYLWRLIPALAALALLIWGSTDSWTQDGPGWLAWAVTIFAGWIIFTWFRRLTGAGDEVLQRARLRFNHIKKYAKSILPNNEANDATILAAIFGIDALPSYHFAYINTLFSPPPNDSESAGGCGGCG
jgi:uncharacterized protein (TIGR04222 family)